MQIINEMHWGDITIFHYQDDDAEGHFQFIDAKTGKEIGMSVYGVLDSLAVQDAAYIYWELTDKNYSREFNSIDEVLSALYIEVEPIESEYYD